MASRQVQGGIGGESGLMHKTYRLIFGPLLWFIYCMTNSYPLDLLTGAYNLADELTSSLSPLPSLGNTPPHANRRKIHAVDPKSFLWGITYQIGEDGEERQLYGNWHRPWQLTSVVATRVGDCHRIDDRVRNGSITNQYGCHVLLLRVKRSHDYDGADVSALRAYRFSQGISFLSGHIMSRSDTTR